MLICFLAGSIIGVIIGFIAFCVGQRQIEIEAVNKGFVKLNMTYYKIEPIEYNFHSNKEP